MNYKETLDYLYSRLPMFQRIGAAAYKANLDNTLAICNLLGNPENKFKSIHVAGTNGKGSTSHMLAAVYQQAGYKTGLYTSPHLKDFRERIKINGKPISKARITSFVAQYKKDFEEIEPSFFEWTVGLAFDFFAKEKVDIAIIEVGLGGRLDSTNVITPLVSLITNISYDHMNLLGDTLQKIATEKAGIIKHNVPVVISQTQRDTQKIFIETAHEKNCMCVFADKLYRPLNEKYFPTKNISRYTFAFKGKKEIIECDLTGSYQLKNIPGVLTALHLASHALPVNEKSIRSGLKLVQTLTGFHGRWEVLSKIPRIIADTGHNEDGIKQVIHCVNREFDSKVVNGKLQVVFGAVNDKDLSSIFKLLRRNSHFKNAQYYFCKPAIPRGLDADTVRKQAASFQLNGSTFSSVRKAILAAKKAAKAKEMIFIGGSTFTVAEAI